MSLNKYVAPPGGGRADHKQTEEKFLPRKNKIVLEQNGIQKKKKKKSVDVYIILILSAVCWRCFQAFIVCGFVSVLFLALVFERWKIA